MFKRVCPACGVVFETKIGQKIFCSKKCSRKAWKRGQETKVDHPCKHNEGVRCTNRSMCYYCGWNPKVEQLRKEAIGCG